MKAFKTCLLIVTMINFQFEFILSSNSGIKMILSQAGLDYAANVASQILEGNMLNKNLGELDGQDGDVRYSIKNIKIVHYSRSSTRTSINSGSITWSLDIHGIKVSSDWNYNWRKNRFLKLSDSGSMTVETRGLSISVDISLSYNSDSGRPTLQTLNCNCRIDNLDIKFSGRTSFIYNLLVGLVENEIKNMLQTQLCRSAREEIDNNGNEELSTLDVDVRLDEDLHFDYRFTSPPQIKDNYIETKHAGMAFGGSFPREYLPSGQPEMEGDSGTKMLSLFISEDSLTSCGNVLIAKVTNTRISKTDFTASDEQIYLDTNCKAIICFVGLLPNVAQSFPNASFEVDYSVLESPKISITPSGLSSNVSGRAVVYVRLSNESTVNLFSIRLHTAFNVSAQVENGFLKLKVLQITPYVSIEEITRTEVQERGILFAMKFLSKVLTRRVNIIIKEGIQIIKTRDILWENTSLEFHDRYLHISADARYVK